MQKQIVVKKGKIYDIPKLVESFHNLGYERNNVPAAPGEFVLRGGIIDIFPVKSTLPVRIDLFGQEAEKIYYYNLATGKKEEEIEELVVCPNRLELADGTRVRPGDYVVHEDYGIGLFKSIGRKKVLDTEREYIFIEYLNGDVLYVPIEQTDKLSSYVGVGRKKPKLSKLGSTTWQKTYKKTYENIIQMARELLQVYAARKIVNRQPWTIDRSFDQEIKKTFPYEETPDQQKAIEEVYKDLIKNIPMDRLIAGDVGFGKTEVAIRAAAQAVANGYQAVLLVPTTILAEQHYVTFKHRFSNLPVSIAKLSRFVTAGEQKEILSSLKQGSTDILIGTHRLLGEDIRLKNAGLFIIDEEQRFGVKQKEAIKKLHTDMNVLNLSATPIPRTLFMALSGLRDISQINTPPGGRKEISTEISKYDESKVKEYVNREVNGGGQVYYLHNEVQTIEGKKRKLMKMFPGLSIAAAHGQMPEQQLAQVMGELACGSIDILVCSTIIENGLDLPNINTLIVEDADRFGLAQLYQIRGRIGRSSRQAYSLFFYPRGSTGQNAFKRLKALAENMELGSGFNIALSDLEIRGGGNVLGREQHGNMEAIGLVLYSKLLNSAIKRLKN